MADTLTTIQYSLGRVEQKLKDLTVFQHPSILMAMAKDGKKIATLRRGVGRALTAYFNIMLRPPGSFGTVASGGSATYPATVAESETQASTILKMFAMTLGYTEHALVALDGDPSAIKVDVNMKINRAVEHVQRKMVDQFVGRGDGTVGRANGAGSGATVITFDDCPLCQVGDVIYSNPDRGIATPGGESGKIEGATVTDVQYDERKVTIASDTWDDGDVIHLSGAAENSGGATDWVQGMMAAYDNPSTDSWSWDEEDTTTYDHCDTYLGLTRSSTTQANCAEYNVNSYLTLAKVQAIVQRSLSRGARPKDLVLVLNPFSLDKLLESIEGYAARTTRVLKLPGGNFEIPVVGHGISQVPVVDDYRIPRGKAICMDKSKVYRLTAPGGWNKREGNFWKRSPTGSTTHYAKFDALFDIWYQLAVVLPNTATVGYGITES
jgi:hypothetical protein